MEKIHKILNNFQYRYNLEKNLEVEKDRIYCRHNLQHFFDVARVAYIMALEKNLKISKEVIYAAALLHDIGKWKQYTEGRKHADVSGEIAKEILKDCGFSKEESLMIIEAIKKHSSGENLTTELDSLLYDADKQSRLCIECKSIKGCKRFKEKDDPKIFY